MLDHVWPESHGCATRVEVSADYLEDGANGAFGHAVQLMHVRRAARVLHRLVGEQLLELPREELARVVGVQSADDAGWLVATLVRDGLELGDERANLGERLGLLLEKVDFLPARVVVDQDQEILVLAVYGAAEGPGDVGVHEAAGVRRLVGAAVVRQVRCVRCFAVSARVRLTAADVGRDVGREVAQTT